MTQMSIYNKELDAYNVPRPVYNAIKNASAKTGVNFSYLLEKAAVESSFDTNAKAKTSSATGLYQFIDSTWLGMVRDHGDKYGLEKYADKIDDNGRVTDAKARKEILNLRKDPEIASLMAAEFDTQNYEKLKANVGGDIGSTELYMAHFLGAGSASGFLNAMNKSPNMAAADLFPREARANRAVFYDGGRPRSLTEVYAFFDNKFSNGKGDASASIMTASNDPSSLRLSNAASAKVTVEEDADVFTRLASLMTNSAQSKASLLRIGGNNEENGWQAFPPSLYGKLSLSPAQMMLLSDFSA